MKIIGMPLMYSGAENPFRLLTEEELNKIKELKEQLTHFWMSPPVHKLGFSGYMVHWESDDPEDSSYLSVYFNGMVLFWDNKNKHVIRMLDTVGLAKYLDEILLPLANGAIKNEDLFGVP